MKIISLMLFFFGGLSVASSQIHGNKIHMIKSEGSTTIVFMNSTIEFNTLESIAVFSEDSQFCAISIGHYGVHCYGFDYFNLEGIKLNKDTIPGYKLFINNDGSYIAYDPLHSEGAFLVNSSLKFYDKNNKLISVNHQFNNNVEVCFLTNGYIFILQDTLPRANRKITNKVELLLLDSNYQIISTRTNFNYESIEFLIPSFSLENELISLPIKLINNSIYYIYLDLKLNTIK